MRVLAIGATGKFAGLVVPELKKRGVTVRALVRDERGEAKARERGADETAIGNLENYGSLRYAAKGVDGVFHVDPAFAWRESELGVSMVRAAKAAGVRKFVFSGVLHPAISSLTNHTAKLPVQDAIYRSGMNFTILQPAMFMQNLQGGWEQVVRTRRFALPYSSEQKACYVDYRDVAEAAAIAFTSPRLDYGTFELCATGMVDRFEMAQMMSDALGHTIDAAQVGFEDWANAANIPHGLARDGLRRMYEEYDQHGFPGGNALSLQTILQREPRTLRQFLRELARGGQTMAA